MKFVGHNPTHSGQPSRRAGRRFLTDDDFDNLSRSDQLTLLPQAPFAALVRGEFMRGEFLGLTGKGVHWKHAGIIESFHLKTGNIRFLELNPTPPTSAG